MLSYNGTFKRVFKRSQQQVRENLKQQSVKK